MRRGSKAKSTRMFVPSGLSSFMFECREPSTVSARGLGKAGPRSSSFFTATVKPLVEPVSVLSPQPQGPTPPSVLL